MSAVPDPIRHDRLKAGYAFTEETDREGDFVSMPDILQDATFIGPSGGCYRLFSDEESSSLQETVQWERPRLSPFPPLEPERPADPVPFRSETIDMPSVEDQPIRQLKERQTLPQMAGVDEEVLSFELPRSEPIKNQKIFQQENSSEQTTSIETTFKRLRAVEGVCGRLLKPKAVSLFDAPMQQRASEASPVGASMFGPSTVGPTIVFDAKKPPVLSDVAVPIVPVMPPNDRPTPQRPELDKTNENQLEASECPEDAFRLELFFTSDPPEERPVLCENGTEFEPAAESPVPDEIETEIAAVVQELIQKTLQTPELPEEVQEQEQELEPIQGTSKPVALLQLSLPNWPKRLSGQLFTKPIRKVKQQRSAAMSSAEPMGLVADAVCQENVTYFFSDEPVSQEMLSGEGGSSVMEDQNNRESVVPEPVVSEPVVIQTNNRNENDMSVPLTARSVEEMIARQSGENGMLRGMDISIYDENEDDAPVTCGAVVPSPTVESEMDRKIPDSLFGAISASAAMKNWQPAWPSFLQTLQPEAVQAVDALAEYLGEAARLGKKIVSFNSFYSGDGCTTMMLCAGRELARTGMKVLLVDTNIHHPELPSMLQAPFDPAMIEIATLEERLDLLPWCDSEIETIDETKERSLFDFCSLVSALRHRYDVILLDNGALSIGPLTDRVRMWTEMCSDGVMLVVNKKNPKSVNLEGIAHRLGQHNIRLMGVAENFG